MENRKVKVKVTHLTKKFGDLLVLNDVSFDVYDGEFLCIVGPTGCGKTTFLNSLTHLYEPTAGNILLDGEEIDLRKHNIAYIFQEYSAMEWAHRPRKRPLRSGHQARLQKHRREGQQRARFGRPDAVCRLLSQAAVGQHAPACRHRARLCDAARSSADGRALRPAGHQPPLQARGRGHPSVQADQNDRPFHHP